MSKQSDRIGRLLHGWGRSVNAVEFVMRRNDARDDIFPGNEPRGVVAGPSPDRVLVLGEGTAVGLGVRTFDLALAAQFARQYAAITGRGVEWSAVEVPGFRLKNAIEGMDAVGPLVSSVDLVIVMLGITDTLLLTSRRKWRDGMGQALDTLLERIPVDAKVLLADVSPMENVFSVSRAGRAAAGHQARVFNSINRELIRSRPRCLRAHFPPELRYQIWKPDGPNEWSRLYGAWAKSMNRSLSDSERSE